MKTNLKFGEEGQTIVELALSIALLLLLLFAVIEGGLVLNTYHTLSYASRLGSRYAIVRGSQCSGLSGGCPATTSDISTYVKSATFVGIDSSRLTVTTTWSASPQSPAPACPSTCNSPGDRVTVRVAYPLSAFQLPFLPALPGTMHSSSTMVISQ